MAGANRRTMFIMTAALLCLAMLAPFMFVAVTAGHDCTHDDSCEVCRVIDVYLHSMRSDTTFAVAAILFAAVVVIAAAILCRMAFPHYASTLISLKTELRN